jgi:EAL domain-containing protein (putative c-di-GMP-specific phosphodiesterase class I)
MFWWEINNQWFVFAHEKIIDITDKIVNILSPDDSWLSLEDKMASHLSVVPAERWELLLRPIDNVSTQVFLEHLIAENKTFELFAYWMDEARNYIQYSVGPKRININAYLTDLIDKRFRWLLWESHNFLAANTQKLTIEILEDDPRIPEINTMGKKKFHEFIDNLEYARSLWFRFAVDDIDATPGNFGRYILDELKKIGKEDLISDIKVAWKIIRKLVDSNYSKASHELRFLQSLKDEYPEQDFVAEWVQYYNEVLLLKELWFKSVQGRDLVLW